MAKTSIKTVWGTLESLDILQSLRIIPLMYDFYFKESEYTFHYQNGKSCLMIGYSYEIFMKTNKLSELWVYDIKQNIFVQ